MCVLAHLLQLCLTLCDLRGYSPPGSSVHGILQTRILEWVAMPSSRGSSGPKDLTCISCVGRWILYHWATWEAHGPSCCYCSAAKSCLTLCNPMNCSTPGFPVLHYLPEVFQTHVHWVSDAIQPSRSLSLLLLPPQSFPASVFSSESALPIRWPNYWSFTFSISPSNE